MTESQGNRELHGDQSGNGPETADAGSDDAADVLTAVPATEIDGGSSPAEEQGAAGSPLTSQQMLNAALQRMSRPDFLVFAAIVVAAGLLRFWDLGDRAVHHDESLHGYYSWVLSEGGGFIHNPLLHGTVQFIATGVVFWLVGASDATLRLLPALAGTIVVALPWLLFRDRLGVWGAVIASGLLAVSPGILYFSRFARNDIYIVLITLILFWTMWAYMDSRRFRYLVIAAAALAVGFATKEIVYLIVLVPITYLVLSHLGWAGRLKAHPRHWPPGAVYALVLITLVLPMGAAGIALFQNVLGIHLANPDANVQAEASVVSHLPGPVGAPISQGPGVVSGIMDFLRGDDAAPSLPQQLTNPEAGTLFGVQSIDVAALVFLGLLGLAAVIGMVWSRSQWPVIAGVFWLTVAALFTTVFSNGAGLGSGVWQSLGYWVAQQEVARGSQPWYYYGMVLGTYDLLPLLAAGVTGIVIIKRRPASPSFDTFLLYWLLLMAALLMAAGEKMPWLSIHLSLPIILLAARGLGEYIPWVAGVLRELPTRADARVVGHAALVGALAILLILTARSSLRASFDNGDVPVELLIYTQTAPALAEAADEIERYAAATGEGHTLPLTIDTAGGFSWPWHWYLRDYGSVEYRCLGGAGLCGEGAQPVTPENAPQGRIMVINHDSARNIQGGDALYGSEGRVLIPLRWWFPEDTYRGEDYAGLGMQDIARGALDPAAWSTIWTYWAYREPPDRLGRSDVYVYFPRDYTPALRTPPDPVHGPA